MGDGFAPYTVVLSDGRLSPAENLETAIIAAAQVRALGKSVVRIECGTEPVLQDEDLKVALTECAGDDARHGGSPHRR